VSRIHWRRRLTAIGVVAAIALGIWALGSSGTERGRRVVAEFDSARGLVDGNDVRIDGAPAGTVTDLSLDEDGTARVEIELHDGLEPLRADASAAIRPVDLIGDNYVALEPGHAAAPLEGPIPADRTLDEPRLDDLLRVFGDPQRAGLKAMLVEGGLALDSRGADLNRMALALRPALAAADGVMGELGSQNADLRRFVTDAERVTGQVADRSEDLGRLVDAADATLAETAARASPLSATLAKLPTGLDQLRRLTSKLAVIARQATPLAASIERSAPALSEAVTRAQPFLARAGDAVDRINPLLGSATDLLAADDPTLAAFDDALGRLGATAPAFDRFLTVFARAAPDISEGFFVNFPDQAAEPGTQPFDPFADPRRHYWRGAAVLSCQSFGLPIAPGCLQRFLGRTDAEPPEPKRHAQAGGGREPASDAAEAAPAPSPSPAPDESSADVSPTSHPGHHHHHGHHGPPDEPTAPETPLESSPPAPQGGGDLGGAVQDILDLLLG
jgi:phospholipid/cholesterol/gamma-HCH transport system substrate-binding protein